MVWAPDLDDFSGSFCNQGKYPLLKSMNDAWFSDALFTWVICQLEISLPFIENKNFAELKISVMYDKFGSLFSLYFEYYSLFYSFIKKKCYFYCFRPPSPAEVTVIATKTVSTVTATDISFKGAMGFENKI